MHSANRRLAWFQGISLVAVLGVIAALLLFETSRPFNRNTLAILTDQLRSDAREAAELARLEAGHASYATFTQQHARELGEHVADLTKTLRGKQAIAALESVRRDAEEISNTLERALSAIAVDHASAIAQASALARLSERADDVHRRVNPGD